MNVLEKRRKKYWKIKITVLYLLIYINVFSNVSVFFFLQIFQTNVLVSILVHLHVFPLLQFISFFSNLHVCMYVFFKQQFPFILLLCYVSCFCCFFLLLFVFNFSFIESVIHNWMRHEATRVLLKATIQHQHLFFCT